MGGVEPGISAMEIWFADVPHRQGFRVHEANRGDMENEPRPSSESPPTPAHFTAVPRKPRLIRQGKVRRPKTAASRPPNACPRGGQSIRGAVKAQRCERYAEILTKNTEAPWSYLLLVNNRAAQREDINSPYADRHFC